MMRIRGESASLPGFEVHHILAAGLCSNAAALQFPCHVLGFVEKGDVDAKGGVRCLGSADRLEDEVDGRAQAHRLHLRGDVG